MSLHSSKLQETMEEVLRRRAQSLAQESVEETAEDVTLLLLFRVDAEWYAVDLAEVREILQHYVVMELPCVPDFVQGVINVRGEILSVCDSARLMRLGQSSEAPDRPAIVLSNGDVATALVVDEIGDIAEVSRDSIEAPVSVIDRAQAEFIVASACVGELMAGLLNTARMLEPVVTGRAK